MIAGDDGNGAEMHEHTYDDDRHDILWQSLVMMGMVLRCTSTLIFIIMVVIMLPTLVTIRMVLRCTHKHTHFHHGGHHAAYFDDVAQMHHHPTLRGQPVTMMVRAMTGKSIENANHHFQSCKTNSSGVPDDKEEQLFW